jgi:LAS superfamily LD-carboxypeptidase LdcB
MEDTGNTHFLKNVLISIGVVIAILIGFSVYQYLQVSTLQKNVSSLTMELASTTATLSQNTAELSQNITDLRAQTIGISNTLSSTQQNIDAVKTQVGGVEQTVGTISGSVGNLEKLSKIDPELLIKYSKVYFMNENYKPAHLSNIPDKYLYSTSNPKEFLAEGWPFLKNMLDAAKADGLDIYVSSAYRSFGEQQSLKSAYTVTYGAGTANSFSADQGYSEHQLGTTVDLITTGLGGQLEGFENTTSYQWLTANAYRFGFVLSYPKDNAFYVYEPWHWRFVGVKLATYLHSKNTGFYALDQREIDTYLINIFD